VHSFPTEGARLRVRNPAGDVRIDPADVAETTVELTPLNDSDATRQAIEKARVEARGDEVTVELEGRSWTISIGPWGIGSAKVSVRITCPHGSTLDCDTASADVKVRGTLGETRLRTASGDLSLEEVDGSFGAKSASGDLELERVTGRCEVHTVSGDVEIGTALETVEVNSVSGDVEIRDAGGALTVSSISGDQNVRAAGPGEIALKAVSGDVEVAIRRGLRIHLDVNSVSGSIRSELEVSDAPVASQGPEAGLRVRTVSGDVRISRAAEALA
jgi:DUF4097 and DUF4098 domain-containing protein YvlB